MLPTGYAQQAQRAKLYDGKLKPWFKMLLIQALVKSAAQTIYPLRSGAGTKWLEWNEVVDVVPARAAGDTTGRIAYTGYGTPKATNFALAGGAAYPADWWRLGVPAPISALTATPGAGGTGVARDRAYLVTFVHAWADGKTEESGPSLASTIVSAKSGQTVDLSSIPRWIITATSITRVGSVATVTIPAGYIDWFGDNDRVTIAGAAQGEYNGTVEITRLSNTQFTYAVTGAPATPATGTVTVKTNHNITAKRLYRTVVGAAGAFYRYVAELAETATTYADSSADSTVALNEVIPSFEAASLVTWDMPPRDMHSIIDCGNGMYAGLSGNVLCVSVPDYPHAWPEVYRRTLPTFDGVGLGIVGNTIVVCTTGYPITYSGTHPSALAETKIERLNHACLSKRSVRSLGYAVKYASKDGLVTFGPGGAGVETNAWYDRESWAHVFPATMRSFQFNDRYFGAFKSGTGPGGDTGGAIIVDRENNIGGIGSDSRYFAGGHFDVTTGELYLISGGSIYQWDGDTSQRELMNYKSAKVILPAPTNFGAAKIDAEFEHSADEVAAISAAASAARAANQLLLPSSTSKGPLNTWILHEGVFGGNDPAVKDIPALLDSPQLTFLLYADGTLRLSRQITATGAFRLPDGFKADNVEWALSGNGIVHRVQLARNMLSLRQQ